LGTSGKEKSAIGGREHKTAEDMVKTQQAEKMYVCAVVNRRVCELATALWLFVDMNCVYKYTINPITNPNSIYFHIPYMDNIFISMKGTTDHVE
jgi:hypothetical protein